MLILAFWAIVQALHAVCFIRNVVNICLVPILHFCSVVSYFSRGILASCFLLKRLIFMQIHIHHTNALLKSSCVKFCLVSFLKSRINGQSVLTNNRAILSFRLCDFISYSSSLTQNKPKILYFGIPLVPRNGWDCLIRITSPNPATRSPCGQNPY